MKATWNADCFIIDRGRYQLNARAILLRSLPKGRSHCLVGIKSKARISEHHRHATCHSRIEINFHTDGLVDGDG